MLQAAPINWQQLAGCLGGSGLWPIMEKLGSATWRHSSCPDTCPWTYLPATGAWGWTATWAFVAGNPSGKPPGPPGLSPAEGQWLMPSDPWMPHIWERPGTELWVKVPLPRIPQDPVPMVCPPDHPACASQPSLDDSSGPTPCQAWLRLAVQLLPVLGLHTGVSTRAGDRGSA